MSSLIATVTIYACSACGRYLVRLNEWKRCWFEIVDLLVMQYIFAEKMRSIGEEKWHERGRRNVRNCLWDWKLNDSRRNFEVEKRVLELFLISWIVLQKVYDGLKNFMWSMNVGEAM
jgi:hypothetical protein